MMKMVTFRHDPDSFIKSSSESPTRPREERLALITDDEEPVRRLMSALLVPYGIKPVTASDGAEAVAQVARLDGALDIIFLDLVMPSLDGIGAFHEIRRLGSDVPVVFMSGLPAPEIRRRLGALSNNPILQKPFTRSELDSIVSTYLPK